MIKSLTLSVLITFACFLPPSKAVEVKDLYLVKLPVAEQGKTSLWKASLKGLKEVLVRKSGSSAILKSQEVGQAYRKVTSYLQRFEYARQEGDSEFPYIISLYFEPRLVDNLIQQSKMPLWGANRPLSIVWLAIEEDFERQIVLESEQQDSLFTVIQQNAIRRGLPIILPLMDLEDELVVSISDIWGRFPSSISQASERYAADVVLFGRINLQGETWQGKFGFINQTSEGAFEVSADSKEMVVAKMMDSLADQLCSKYCVIEEVGQKNELLIDVTDINNFQEYKAAEFYLENLSSVSKVEVLSIEQFNVLFKLTLFGQINSTIEGIGLSQKMLSIDPPVRIDNLVDTKQLDSIDGQSLNQTASETEDEQNPDASSIPVTETIEENTKLNQLEIDAIQTLYYRWIG